MLGSAAADSRCIFQKLILEAGWAFCHRELKLKPSKVLPSPYGHRFLIGFCFLQACEFPLGQIRRLESSCTGKSFLKPYLCTNSLKIHSPLLMACFAMRIWSVHTCGCNKYRKIKPCCFGSLYTTTYFRYFSFVLCLLKWLMDIIFNKLVPFAPCGYSYDSAHLSNEVKYYLIDPRQRVYVAHGNMVMLADVEPSLFSFCINL